MTATPSRKERADAALALHGTVRRAAASLGIAASTFQGWAASGSPGDAPAAAPVLTGAVRIQPREVLPLPNPGQVKTYLFTTAQNNTGLMLPAWNSLLTLAAADRAQIFVARTTYATNGRAANGQKATKTAREPAGAVEVWDDRLTPYFCDRSVQIAPGLVWCGDLQILPTVEDPISGYESHTGRASCIIPHTTLAMKSIPSPKMSGTKFIYTTGTVTLRNYIQKKAGQKAAFHHGYGAVIVEVRSDGSWFVRQLNADSEGTIYDIDPKGNACRRISAGRITTGHRPEALVWGDIHTRQLEAELRHIGWGHGGILDALKPKRQVLHDVFDFRSQNHHDRKDPWKGYAKHVTKKTNVGDEVRELHAFLREATRTWCETAIVASNHDEALMRWLKEVDHREDHTNALFILETTAAVYHAIRNGDDKLKRFYVFEYVTRRADDAKLTNVRFLRRDEKYVVCKDAHGGIELANHGDKGANGARGATKTFARSGVKCILGDGHYAEVFQGAMRVGVMGALDQDYNEGMSSWSHTNALVMPNGKRMLFTIWQGRYHGRSKLVPQKR